MPKLSPKTEAKLNEKKQKARELYWTGLSLRAVGHKMGMSHEWVRTALKR